MQRRQPAGRPLTPRAMLIDTHAHLDAKAFRDDLPEVIARARDAGVTRIVAIATGLESSRRCLEIAERHPEVWATVGIHPTDVTDVDDPAWRDRLAELAAHPRCVAIGETGLDYYHPAPDGWQTDDYRARQREFFAAHLELAAATGLGIVVHQRDRSGTPCWDDIRRMVAPWNGRVRAVFHCFTHPWSEAAPVVAAGHRISFTGIATYRNPGNVADCAAHAPDGSFFLETDSPYLAPVPQRGRRNEPAFTRLTAETIAALRHTTLESLANTTTAAASEFFRRLPHPH